MFCLLIVLTKLLLLAKWLARKTPLRKPNRGEGIISIKPRPKNAHGFLGLLHCFVVLLCICVVSCPYVIYYPTVMAWYSLFVLKVSLNPKQTNKQTNKLMMSHSLIHLSSSTCSPLSPSITFTYFIPGSKLTFSTNLFHHCVLAPTWTAFSDYTRPELFCLTVFIFSYFYFGSCSRSSWLNCQLSSAC